MKTEKDYCDYDTCVALKELGYKVPTSAYYISNDTTLYFVSNPFRGGYAIDCFYSHNSLREGVITSNYIDAPTMWEAQKWLREKEKIDVLVYLDDLKGYYYYIRVWNGTWEMAIKHDQLGLKGIVYNDSYEEVLLEGIKEVIKLLKEEK
ncbi:MAG: hypothetical protein IKV75_05745 [Bacteroidales bacterium]|nr:hypothetical protein [Bacteroidales bacterium]